MNQPGILARPDENGHFRPVGEVSTDSFPELIQAKGRLGAHQVTNLDMRGRLDLLERFAENGWGYMGTTRNFAAGGEVWLFCKHV